MKNAKIQTYGRVFVIALALVGGIHVTSALISVTNTSEIKASWETFELGRSEKARALSALRKEFGYGGMIHHFKNYILRQDPVRIGIVNANLGGISAAISRYAALDLNAQESVALNDVRETIKAYSKNLRIAEKIFRQGKTSLEVDQMVKINDAPALAGLEILEQNTGSTSGADGILTSKPQILAMLRKSLGYGGMIHQFKNYILRQDHPRLAITNNHIAAANNALVMYTQLSLSPAEKQSIAKISAIVDNYAKALVTTTQLIQKGHSPKEIDRAVTIDDGPALRGCDILTHEISHQSEVEARNLENSLAVISAVSVSSAWITAATTIILIAAMIWMFRSQIVGPIDGMTNTMTKLARGKLDLPIHGVAQSNEIGEMARALEVFKANAHALQNAHDEQEKQVFERTKELRYSERRFRDFAGTASDWFWEMGPDLQFTYGSDRFYEITGWQRGEIYGNGREFLIDPKLEDLKARKWLDHFAQLERRETFNNFEYAVRTKEGGPKYLSLNGMPVFAADGTFLGYRGTGSNITEKQQAQNAQRESEEKYRSIFDAAQVGILRTRLSDGAVIDANERQALMLGYKNREDFLTNYDPLIHWSSPEARDEWIRNGQALGYVQDRTVEMKQRDGSMVWLHTSATFHPGIDCIDIVSIDITETKHHEAAIIAAREEADYANRTKSEFLAHFSHELRTPLNAIIGFSEMMQHEIYGPLGNERYIEYAGDIHHSGGLLLALISDILDLSRIEAGQLEQNEEVFDVAPLLEDCARLLRNRAEKKGVTIDLLPPVSGLRLCADERQIRQILLNLLSNAVKFTRPDTVITQEVEIDGNGDIHFHIRDRGTGMTAADLVRVQEPFIRLEGANTSQEEGTGLGLAITKRIAQSHAGSLTLSSEVGVGTTATVSFLSERVVLPKPAANGFS